MIDPILISKIALTYDDSWDEDFDYEDEEVHIESVCEDDAEETNTLLKKLMGLNDLYQSTCLLVWDFHIYL